MKRARDERSMRETAYLHIQKKIASRVLRAGAPVSELPIASELGISRTPTREAIRQLVAEGILREVPGRGVTVTTLDRRDILEMYEIREALEVQGIEKIVRQQLSELEKRNLGKITDTMAELIEELRSSGRERLDEKQMARFEAADIAFHTYMLQIAGNSRTLEISNKFRLLIGIFAMRHAGHELKTLERIHGDHCEITNAILSKDSARAIAAVSSHIQVSQRTRLAEFDQREREGALPQDIPAFIDGIQAQLT